MSKKPWRRLSLDDEKRLRFLTYKGVLLDDIAAEFGMSKAWVCKKQGEYNMLDPSSDPILRTLSPDDVSTLNLAAEARGTNLLGLCTAILETLAREPFLIDAVLDDEKQTKGATNV